MSPPNMQMMVLPGGLLRAIYGEAIDLRRIGRPRIQRASHVEPDRHGNWFVNLRPVGGPRLGPFRRRRDALRAERRWLKKYWF